MHTKGVVDSIFTESFFLFFLNRRISTTSYDEDADNEVFEDAYKSATRLSLLPETQS